MKISAEKSKDQPVTLFASQKDWAKWLDKHHASSSGLWLRLAKKASELTSVSYAEALDVALCYGWIDGQKKSYDEESWLQKFTPRGAKSIWSKINREKAESLIETGKMSPAGLRAIESAKRDGRWDAAYDSQSKASIPEDFQAELDRNPKAKEFFAKLNSANRYAILWRVQTAKKAETRARRIHQFIEMLERNETLHPQA
ncbi:MAG: YdeI/OmpD-associated family protein [Acidobacteria bacterium]|nr:YdeI/OmpD-associated family protein [Acidobacteriota bacterium]